MERITLKQFDEEYFASCLVDKHSFSVDYLDDTRIGLSWGSSINHYIKRLLLIREDHSYTFKTVDQKYNSSLLHLKYGP